MLLAIATAWLDVEPSGLYGCGRTPLHPGPLTVLCQGGIFTTQLKSYRQPWIAVHKEGADEFGGFL